MIDPILAPFIFQLVIEILPELALLGGTAAAVVAALTYWHKILDWAEKSLFPWITRNLPWLENQVRFAFSAVDGVAVPIRAGVKQAWNKLRDYLLKQTAELQRKSSSQWIVRITSWVVKVLESGKTIPAKLEVKEIVVDWDELPEDIRSAYLRRQHEHAEFNITQMRDRELAEMEMTN